MSKSELLQIRVTPEMKDKLKKVAESENRTVSNYIESLIIQALKSHKEVSP